MFFLIRLKFIHNLFFSLHTNHFQSMGQKQRNAGDYGCLPRCRTFLRKITGFLNGVDYTSRIVSSEDIRTALDIGCGILSPLTAFRPKMWTVGIDAFEPSINKAQKLNSHDMYLHGDITEFDPQEILNLTIGKGKRFDLVVLYEVIEHLNKKDGLKLLENLKLIAKRILVETPNGFFPQGAVGGNKYQCHLSGWTGDEFEKKGFNVYGSSGLRVLHGEQGSYRVRIPGIKVIEVLMWILLRSGVNYRHAFNLVAIWEDPDVAENCNRE